MRVGIRVDASATIGTGHLHRCLSLADSLVRHGATVRFVVRRQDATAEIILDAHGQNPAWLEGSGISADRPSAGHDEWLAIPAARDAIDTIAALQAFAPEWLVVDHYALGVDWHRAVRAGLDCRVLVIDDLGDRPLDPDVLVDGNIGASAGKYPAPLARPCRMLLGSPYALLSSIYQTAPRLQIRPKVTSIGIFMGGTDPDGASAKIVGTLLDKGGFEGAIEVVSTSANPHLNALREICARHPAVALSLDLPNLAAFYARHDLQVGAAGSASYERCCIGAPAIALVLAENQMAVAPGLMALGAIEPAKFPQLPASDRLPDAPDLVDAVSALIAAPEKRARMAEIGRALIDGRGAERVALALMADAVTVRPASLDDGAMLHRWRDDPAVRAVSSDPAHIALDDHMRWLEASLRAPDRRLYVASVGPTAVGSVRFDRLGEHRLEVSLYLDPGLTGLGLGSRMLIAGEQAVTLAAGGDLTVEASVMPGNAASVKLFTGCGYAGGPLRFEKRVSLGTPTS